MPLALILVPMVTLLLHDAVIVDILEHVQPHGSRQVLKSAGLRLNKHSLENGSSEYPRISLC